MFRNFQSEHLIFSLKQAIVGNNKPAMCGAVSSHGSHCTVENTRRGVASVSNKFSKVVSI